MLIFGFYLIKDMWVEEAAAISRRRKDYDNVMNKLKARFSYSSFFELFEDTESNQ